MSVPPPMESPPGMAGGGHHRLPRFFFNSAGTSPPSPLHSHHHEPITSSHPPHHRSSSGHTTYPSDPSTPGHSRRPSRTSISASRAGMTRYRIPTSEEYFPGVMELDNEDISPLLSPNMDRHHVDACLEIHRTLYRGRDHVSVPADWREHAPVLQRVVERLIDADCKYDNPMIKVQSRQSVLTHFILLHILSTGFIPHLTPSNVIHILSDCTSHLRYRVLGQDSRDQSHDVEHNPVGSASLKGKKKMDSLDWTPMEVPKRLRGHEAKWWPLWEVSANCTDIGNLHSQNGDHFTLIEHVITLTLFPTIFRKQPPRALLRLSESVASIFSHEEPLRQSFSERLVSAVAEELDYLFTWDLPVSTTVRFNENGKATQIRDSVDIVDVVETFVPFAKRIGWLTRRLTGMVSSTLGNVAFSVIPETLITVKPDNLKLALGSPIGLGVSKLPAPSNVQSPSYQARSLQDNSLGLEGIAPDSQSVYSS